MGNKVCDELLSPCSVLIKMQLHDRAEQVHHNTTANIQRSLSMCLTLASGFCFFNSLVILTNNTVRWAETVPTLRARKQATGKQNAVFSRPPPQLEAHQESALTFIESLLHPRQSPNPFPVLLAPSVPPTML